MPKKRKKTKSYTCTGEATFTFTIEGITADSEEEAKEIAEKMATEAVTDMPAGGHIDDVDITYCDVEPEED